jgi:hypothetical protein
MALASMAGLLLHCCSCAVVLDEVINSETTDVVKPELSKVTGVQRLPAGLDRYPFKGSTVAVLTFDVRVGISANEVALFADRFEVEFSAAGVQRPVSRSKMKEVLDLQKFSASCGNTECAIEAGQLLNVEYMIYGSVGRINRLSTVNIYMTSVEKGEVVVSATTDYEGSPEGFIKNGVKQAVNAFLKSALAKKSPARTGE